MDDFIVYLNSLNTHTLIVIGLLVFAAGFIMQVITDSKWLTSMFVISFQSGALFLNYLAITYDVRLFSDADTNLIALSTLGMIAGLGAVILMMRSTTAALDAARPKMPRQAN